MFLSVAPMLDWTNRHCRYWLRLFSQHIVLYTEMITAHALWHGQREFLLKFHSAEHPVVLQLGGSDPQLLAFAARLAADFGYDAVNLNIGCPSTAVTEGRFGACLMKEPERVAECVHAMRQAVDLPITVKTRLGVDEFDSYAFLKNFVMQVAAAGCTTFILHARKAWLKGLSPKQNREIPPLRYEIVYQLKREFPHLQIHLNGGVKTAAEIRQHLQHVDGVMIGREAYHNPYLLASIDQEFYGASHPVASRADLIAAYLPYVHKELSDGTMLSHLTRPLLGLFHGQSGARIWRRYLTEHRQGGVEIVQEALKRAQQAARPHD